MRSLSPELLCKPYHNHKKEVRLGVEASFLGKSDLLGETSETLPEAGVPRKPERRSVLGRGGGTGRGLCELRESRRAGR